jgi:hypothetical protein
MPSKGLFISLSGTFPLKILVCNLKNWRESTLGSIPVKKGAKKGASEISRLKGKGEVCIIP